MRKKKCLNDRANHENLDLSRFLFFIFVQKLDLSDQKNVLQLFHILLPHAIYIYTRKIFYRNYNGLFWSGFIAAIPFFLPMTDWSTYCWEQSYLCFLNDIHGAKCLRSPRRIVYEGMQLFDISYLLHHQIGLEVCRILASGAEVWVVGWGYGEGWSEMEEPTVKSVGTGKWEKGWIEKLEQIKKERGKLWSTK